MILAELHDGRMDLPEVHRFQNGMQEKNGALCWDVEQLFSEIKTGMKKCEEIGKIPVSVSVDTWGVDFVLLNKEDNVIGDTVDIGITETEGMDRKDRISDFSRRTLSTVGNSEAVIQYDLSASGN